MSEQSNSDTERCYVGDCESEHADIEAVEAHIRETDDYAHNVTGAFLPSGADHSGEGNPDA